MIVVRLLLKPTEGGYVAVGLLEVLDEAGIPFSGD